MFANELPSYYYINIILGGVNYNLWTIKTTELNVRMMC